MLYVARNNDLQLVQNCHK